MILDGTWTPHEATRVLAWVHPDTTVWSHSSIYNRQCRALAGPRTLPTSNLKEIHSVVPQITHVDGHDIHIMCSFYALPVSYSQIQSRCKFTLLFYCFVKFCWILPTNSLKIPVTMRTGLVWKLTLYFLFSRHLAQEADVSYFGSSMAVINGEDGTWILPETRNTIDLFKLRNNTDNASAVTCKRHIQIYSWCARVVRLLIIFFILISNQNNTNPIS